MVILRSETTQDYSKLSLLLPNPKYLPYGQHTNEEATECGTFVFTTHKPPQAVTFLSNQIVYLEEFTFGDSVTCPTRGLECFLF